MSDFEGVNPSPTNLVGCVLCTHRTDVAPKTVRGDHAPYGVLCHGIGGVEPHPTGIAAHGLYPPLPLPHPSNNATRNLVCFYTFKQRAEIAFAEAVIAFALDEFKKYRADHGF